MKYFTSKEVADLTGIGNSTVRKWAKENNIKSFGKSYLWTEEDIEAFKSRNTQRGYPAHKKNVRKFD